MKVPAILLEHLQKLEPDSQFTAKLPRIDSSSGMQYFAKLGSVNEAEQYLGEAESLLDMHKAAPGLVPQIFVCGVSDETGKPYFVSEYKNLGGLTDRSTETLGKRLATELHAYKSEQGFGFGIPTYCGVTRLKNGWFETWTGCYSSLIEDLLAQLRQKGYVELCRKAEEVKQRVIPALLDNLKIEPVLLHGDLWSGNTGTDNSTGEPIIFDPSSYYGHNEADLAIGRMFGGIPRIFYETYHAHKSKAEPVEQYELRQTLYELFHHLNHALIFGGGYASSSMGKIEILLRAEASGRL